MMTAMRVLGAVGVISDGPSRDVDEIRPMGMQYLITGTSPGHGAFSVKAVNVPVRLCGMDVAPGEIVHMDENGACKFPADQVCELANACWLWKAIARPSCGSSAEAIYPHIGFEDPELPVSGLILRKGKTPEN